MQFCFRKLSAKNKKVNTTVYNKNKYYLICYMFEPRTINKRQENLHFSGGRIDQRTVTLSDVHPVQHPHTVLAHAINI